MRKYICNKLQEQSQRQKGKRREEICHILTRKYLVLETSLQLLEIISNINAVEQR